MAAEYNRVTLPRGSKVQIFEHDNSTCIATGALAEEWTITLSSEFGQLVDSGANDAFTVLGGAVSRMSGGKFGFSSQFKQMGFQIWKGTAPVTLQFSLEFHFTYNAQEEVRRPIERLCEIPLPGEGLAGNLIPPGPSILEAISGTSASNAAPDMDSPPAESSEKVRGADSYVNVIIGGMVFMGCIMTNAEPTFSRRTDETDSPIYGRVAVTMITMYTATKESIRESMLPT
jgi:hypothetical protein